MSGTSDPSATYSSAKCREKSCATASTSRHSSSVTGRASSPKRSSSARLSRSPRSASGNSRSIQAQSPETSCAAVPASAWHAPAPTARATAAQPLPGRVARPFRRRFEHEALDGDVGVDVVGAEKGDHLASGDLFDAGAEVVAHAWLVGPAGLEHEVGLAVADEAALALRQEVLHDDGDEVVVEVRAGPGGAAAGVLAEQPHDEIADGQAVGACRVGSNRALAITSSVLASLLRAESRERRKETDEIRRATRLPDHTLRQAARRGQRRLSTLQQPRADRETYPLGASARNATMRVDPGVGEAPGAGPTPRMPAAGAARPTGQPRWAEVSAWLPSSTRSPPFDLTVVREGRSQPWSSSASWISRPPRGCRAPLKEHSDAEVLVVDLTATTFMDSSGVRNLIEAHRLGAREGFRLVVVAGAGPVRRVLDLCGLDRQLTITTARPTRR